MAGLGGFISGGLPMFDGSCFDDWKIKCARCLDSKMWPR